MGPAALEHQGCSAKVSLSFYPRPSTVAVAVKVELCVVAAGLMLSCVVDFYCSFMAPPCLLC